MTDATSDKRSSGSCSPWKSAPPTEEGLYLYRVAEGVARRGDVGMDGTVFDHHAPRYLCTACGAIGGNDDQAFELCNEETIVDATKVYLAGARAGLAEAVKRIRVQKIGAGGGPRRLDERRR